MADIELVVKIPEEIYKASQIVDVKHEDVIQIPLEVITNGTPLPKGHRFIDADEILNHAFIRDDEEGDIFVQKYYCIKKEVMDNALVLFDTLEADKEKE